MQVHVITIFPELFETILDIGIVGRAQKSGLVEVDAVAERLVPTLEGLAVADTLAASLGITSG